MDAGMIEDLIVKVEGQRGKRSEMLEELGIARSTYYKWRRQYGGMRVSQAKRLKELEKENARLKKLVADQALDNAILKDVAEGNL